VLALLVPGHLALGGLHRRLFDLLTYAGHAGHPSLSPRGYRSAPDELDRGDVVRLHALLALGRLVGDLGTLVEGLEAAPGYTRMVDEEVFATLIRGDEAVALLVAEPLNRSLGHIGARLSFEGPHRNKKAAPLVEGGASVTIKPAISTYTLTIPQLGAGTPQRGEVRRIPVLRTWMNRGQDVSMLRLQVIKVASLWGRWTYQRWR